MNNSFLDTQDIERRLTVVRMPQQNGIAERMNRTLLDMARCLLIQFRLPLMFWAEAIATASHIRNRCPSSSLCGDVPFERWSNRKATWNYLRVFGATVYVLDKDPSKGKLSKRSKRGVFVGYPRETKGYRIWLPEDKKFIVARDVCFQENSTTGSMDDIREITLIDDDIVEPEENSQI